MKILNCQAVVEAEKNMVFAARLTQRGHRIATMEDLLVLYEKSFSTDTVEAIGGLPHPTVQKFAVITVAVVGGEQAVPRTDHQTSERGEVYECFAAVQQLCRTGGFCHTL